MKTISIKERPQFEQLREEPIRELIREPVREPPQQMPPEKRKVEIDKFNNNSVVKANNIIAVDKRFYRLIIILLIIFTSIALLQVIWSNINTSIGKYADNVNTTIIVEPTDVEVQAPIEIDDKDTNNYEHTINVENNVKVDKDFLEDFIDDIIEGVLEGLNETG